MSQLALNEYTLMLMAPMMLGLLARSCGRLRQPFNLIISNVPGPEEFLYYNGARLEEMYPFSIVTDDQALNITALSYAGHLHIGLTACAQTIPDLDSLAVAMHKEYSLLERLYRAASCPLLGGGHGCNRARLGPVRVTPMRAGHAVDDNGVPIRLTHGVAQPPNATH